MEAYLLKLMYASPYKKFVDKKEIRQLLKQEPAYNLSAAYKIFAEWQRTILTNKVYTAYKPLSEIFLQQPAAEPVCNSYHTELANLVGLAPVKSVVKKILAYFKIQKVRTYLGAADFNFSKHMIFTGNPGTAKTTVARILAGLLAAEGILSSGKLVECGRSDLVGKYVGWTAKAVKENFREAAGGILFIDEAYALADESNSFGDEAINTIVQEMENRRSNVLVIFAGYPDKMQHFLDKNEGLRSRIAFHINFPDYNPQELCEILQYMAKERGYCINRSALPKCQRIFKGVYQHPEFGNGRFVRNLLEQAIMQQALRLTEECPDQKLTLENLSLLEAGDFNTDIALPFQTKTKLYKPIGFVA